LAGVAGAADARVDAAEIRIHSATDGAMRACA